MRVISVHSYVIHSWSVIVESARRSISLSPLRWPHAAPPQTLGISPLQVIGERLRHERAIFRLVRRLAFRERIVAGRETAPTDPEVHRRIRHIRLARIHFLEAVLVTQSERRHGCGGSV